MACKEINEIIKNYETSALNNYITLCNINHDSNDREDCLYYGQMSDKANSLLERYQKAEICIDFMEVRSEPLFNFIMAFNYEKDPTYSHILKQKAGLELKIPSMDNSMDDIKKELMNADHVHLTYVSWDRQISKAYVNGIINDNERRFFINIADYLQDYCNDVLSGKLDEYVYVADDEKPKQKCLIIDNVHI